MGGTGLPVEHGEAAFASFYVEKQPWVADALCLGAASAAFFEDCESHSFGGRLRAIEAALDICNSCPVRIACATQALIEEGSASSGRYGIRGGMTPAQREVVYRRGGLRGRDPAQLVRGRDGRRRIPAIPLDGVAWSRHHTTLARKLVAWLEPKHKGYHLPSVPKLCDALSCNPVPLRHVLTELWASGVLDKRDGYTYRGNAIDSSLPKQLSPASTGEGDSRA